MYPNHHQQSKLHSILADPSWTAKLQAAMSSKEATFAALTAEFELDDKIKALFLKGPMENLQDFCFYFAEEKEIDAFVAEDDTLTEQEQKIQTARMRRAWAAVRQNELRNENRSTTSSAAKLDDLVEEVTLKGLKLQFWTRYRMRHPAHINPSDQLLSRCYREVKTRLLSVYDIWKVKTLLNQVTTTKRRKRVGVDLYTFEDDAEETPGTYDLDSYLTMLHTYLLALSIAGSNEAQGPQIEEAFGSDSIKFVEIPWDVMQSYYYRAVHSTMKVPETSRLTWLQANDIAERTVWVSQFRGGDEPLGQVVQAIMEKRGAHWDTPIVAFPPQPPPPPFR